MAVDSPPLPRPHSAEAPKQEPPPGVKAVAAGTWHACVIASDTSVWCWGWNGSGQLGDGTFTASRGPVRVRDLTGARALSLGNRTSCALTNEGRVMCWGNGDTFNGKVTSEPATAAPARLDDAVIDGVAQVTVGEFHVCLRMESGQLVCSSDRNFTTRGMRSYERVVLPEVPDAVDLCSGYMQACAVRANGDVWCWGDPHGKTSHIGAVEPPGVRIALPGPARKVTCGKSSSCALLASRQVVCWGEQYDSDPNKPVAMSTPLALDVASSLTGTCISHDQGIACWQHWPGTPGSPAAVPRLGPVSGLTVGAGFACALANGQVYCWGENDRGQIGTGTGERRVDSPVRVLIPQ